MVRAVWTFVVVLLLGGAVLLGPAQLQALRIDKQETSVRVSWVMQSEESVARYVLKRKTGYSREYQELTQVTQLLGPQQEYVYVDPDLYKGAVEEVHYQLEVHYHGGIAPDVFEQSTTYQPTAVRRTWGSIKAMFQ